MVEHYKTIKMFVKHLIEWETVCKVERESKVNYLNYKICIEN